jgi:hypothetical protein
MRGLRNPLTLLGLLVTVCLLSAPLAAAAPASSGVVSACMLTKGVQGKGVNKKTRKATKGLLRVVRTTKACKKKRGEKPIVLAAGAASGVSGTNGSSGENGSNGNAFRAVVPGIAPRELPAKPARGVMPGTTTRSPSGCAG